MTTYFSLNQKIEKLYQLASAAESVGAQVPELRRGIRNLESAISGFPKAKAEDKIHNDVAEEAKFMMMVMQRFITNQSMACYYLAQRGKSDAFKACSMKLANAIRNWQSANMNFDLLPEEASASDSKKKPEPAPKKKK